MNIATSLRRAAADHAGQVALRLDEQEVRYGHLADTAARFAAHLRAEGLVAGQRVGVFLPNALEYVPAVLGVWQAGGVAVPLNYLFPEAALRHAIVDSGATHIVTGPADAARLDALLAGEKVTLLTTGPEGSFSRALARSEPSDRLRRIEVVDALPRTGSGKLNRPELRKLYP